MSLNTGNKIESLQNTNLLPSMIHTEKFLNAKKWIIDVCSTFFFFYDCALKLNISL